jgi:hypothetical protein
MLLNHYSGVVTFMKKILVFLAILPLNNAFSDEMSSEDCKQFLPYHSYNIAVSGICGELLPPDVASQHIYFRGLCTQKLGEKRSMELMKQGTRKFGKTLSKVGQQEMCRAEAKIIAETINESNQ